MGATQFICPNKERVDIDQCLEYCPYSIRCMGKPVLETVADSLKNRRLGKKYSVTELLLGTREAYLKRTTDYAVDPQERIFAMHGSAVHFICEKNASPSMLTEVRLSNDTFTGQIDAYGKLLGGGSNVLLDYKVTSSYKAALALGYYKVDEPTGEYYKTGSRKGEPKTKKVLKEGGVRHILSWAIQINAYRMLLEEHNFKVDGMYMQMYVRDYSPKLSAERKIDKPLYLVKVNKISDRWLKRYFMAKKIRLDNALMLNEVPSFCRKSEAWNGRKCQDYCNVFEACKKTYEQQQEQKGETNNEEAA